ncbi:cd63 antigen, variant 2 [Dermatophagoides farinae]|uniref:Cd63 antigen, variant 2 n=1 Tax=Dermatophagoides farinae TaxID=6954 RepID=A0A922IDD9_DERFA|nr:cd63 antigen, variant 2 [Dermatophagoides farinae]
MYPMATSFIIDRIEYTTEKKTKLQYMPKRLQPLYVLEVELERIYLLTNKKKHCSLIILLANSSNKQQISKRKLKTLIDNCCHLSYLHHIRDKLRQLLLNNHHSVFLRNPLQSHFCFVDST